MLRSPGALPAALILAAAAGCPPPAYEATSAAPWDSTGAESTGGPAESTATSTSESSSTDSESTGAGTTGEATATTGAGATTGEPAQDLVPKIVWAKVTPTNVLAPGPVVVEAGTEHTEWLEASALGGTFAMTEVAPDHFIGEFPVTSELFDGKHTVTLAPHNWKEQGEELTRIITSDLPQAGTEAFWEAAPTLGEGLAEVVVPGPDGSLFEFGTLEPGIVPRCYLRRRGPDGTAGPNDTIAVQAGLPCSALDAAIEADGRLLILYEYEKLGLVRWALDRHDPWNKTLSTVLIGIEGTHAKAIATGAGDKLVVCGSYETGTLDKFDAMVWGSAPGFFQTLDLKYQPNEMDHQYGEEIHDCAFVGDKLVLAGDAYGQHPDENEYYERHLVIEFGVYTKQAQWTVAPLEPGPNTQSSAQAITPASGGRYITAGHVCGAPCFPQLELREFKLGGTLEHSYRPAVETTSPTAIAWHPAGYAVVTAGEIVNGGWTKMWAQAWMPGETDALWTFSRSDTEGIHWPRDVAVGKYGWIHFVGIADIGGPLVPTFVTLYP